ncbi:hypothetical protein BV25DRAFT_1830973 [Artomyces pyxidatus]|uniref:Uncharacterized protein n=1 Tax=Artomyces pyxidatus TaxID=48021 RepID=A0ACB8SMU0_9AGAM|nr:hypothetical protein BV25DRAFT_1830973 [Artomyces pyxidatus]
MNKADILTKRGISVVLWAFEHLQCLQVIAKSMMHLAPRDAPEHYACIVYVDVDVLRVDPEAPATAKAVTFSPRISNFRCAPLSEIRAILDTISSRSVRTHAAIHAEIDKELAPSPDSTPLALVDLTNAHHVYEYGVHFLQGPIKEALKTAGWMEGASPHAGCREWVPELPAET